MTLLKVKMDKYSLSSDPRGLIYEAYKIEEITSEDCRSIFFDWALGLNSELNAFDELTKLYSVYAKDNPTHPMSVVLKEGLSKLNRKPSRRRSRN